MLARCGLNPFIAARLLLQRSISRAGPAIASRGASSIGLLSSRPDPVDTLATGVHRVSVQWRSVQCVTSARPRSFTTASAKRPVVRLEEYRPPPFLIDRSDLVFVLPTASSSDCLVRNQMTIRIPPPRHDASATQQPNVLSFDGHVSMKLLHLSINGNVCKYMHPALRLTGSIQPLQVDYCRSPLSCD